MYGYDVDAEYEKIIRTWYRHDESEHSNYRRKTMESDEMLKVSEFCGDYGWSAQRMNKWLGEHGIQYKRAKGASWIPSLRWERLGLVLMITNDYYGKFGMVYFSCTNYWSPVARVMIHDILSREGIHPVEEVANA